MRVKRQLTMQTAGVEPSVEPQCGAPVWCGLVLGALYIQAGGVPWTGGPLPPPIRSFTFTSHPFLSLSYLGTIYVCSNSL